MMSLRINRMKGDVSVREEYNRAGTAVTFVP
jgi:hypothetical protein